MDDVETIAEVAANVDLEELTPSQIRQIQNPAIRAAILEAKARGNEIRADYTSHSQHADHGQSTNTEKEFTRPATRE